MTFGALDGILNAMPKGGLLSNCGINLLAQRTLYINASNLYAERELTQAVTNLYKGMQYIYKVNYNCYYGAISVINQAYLTALITNLKILENLMFNVGFIYTDIMMLYIGKPGETESDYAYYLAFYIGDFIFRFIFKETGDGNCWYPWNACYTGI